MQPTRRGIDLKDYKITITKSPLNKCSLSDCLNGTTEIFRHYSIVYVPDDVEWAYGDKRGTEAQVRSYAETVIAKRKNSPSCLQFNKVKTKKRLGLN